MPPPPPVLLMESDQLELLLICLAMTCATGSAARGVGSRGRKMPPRGVSIAAELRAVVLLPADGDRPHESRSSSAPESACRRVVEAGDSGCGSGPARITFAHSTGRYASGVGARGCCCPCSLLQLCPRAPRAAPAPPAPPPFPTPPRPQIRGECQGCGLGRPRSSAKSSMSLFPSSSQPLAKVCAASSPWSLFPEPPAPSCSAGTTADSSWAIRCSCATILSATSAAANKVGA